MAGVKGRSGGKRIGAGRPKAYLYQRHITAADKSIAPRLKEFLALIEQLGRGEIEIVREVWKPAALVLVDKTEFQEQVKKGKDGEETTALVAVKVKAPAFPQMRPTDMVLVEKRLGSGLPYLPALMYLVNRIMGRPDTQPDEPETPEVAPKYDLSRLTGVEIATLTALLEKAAPASLAAEGG